MGCRYGEKHFLFPQYGNLLPGKGIRTIKGHNGAVDPLIQQHPCKGGHIGFRDLNGHLGKLLFVRGYDLRQHPQAKLGRDPNGDMAFIVQAAYVLIKVLLDPYHLPGSLHIQFPCRGQQKLPFCPYEQRIPDLLLQPGQILAQGGLGHIQFLRSLCHVFSSCNG